MAWRRIGDKPLSEPVLDNCQLDPRERLSVRFESIYNDIHSRNCVSKCRLYNGGHFVSALMCWSSMESTDVWRAMDGPMERTKWPSVLMATEINTLRPKQDGRHFPDDILKCIFLNENVWIALTISLKCVRKVRTNNIPSLVQIMAWRRPGDKPLTEPIMVSLPTQTCVTRPRWVKMICVTIMTVISMNTLIIIQQQWDRLN